MTGKVLLFARFCFCAQKSLPFYPEARYVIIRNKVILQDVHFMDV